MAALLRALPWMLITPGLCAAMAAPPGFCVAGAAALPDEACLLKRLPLMLRTELADACIGPEAFTPVAAAAAEVRRGSIVLVLWLLAGARS